MFAFSGGPIVVATLTTIDVRELRSSAIVRRGQCSGLVPPLNVLEPHCVSIQTSGIPSTENRNEIKRSHNANPSIHLTPRGSSTSVTPFPVPFPVCSRGQDGEIYRQDPRGLAALLSMKMAKSISMDTARWRDNDRQRHLHRSPDQCRHTLLLDRLLCFRGVYHVHQANMPEIIYCSTTTLSSSRDLCRGNQAKRLSPIPLSTDRLLSSTTANLLY